MAEANRESTERQVLDAQHQEITQLQLDTLPLELLIEIFSYLATRQDLISCCRVSKAFYTAAVSPSLWKSLCRKVWRIIKDKDENWKKCYAEMFINWGRYEKCYSNIRRAWDLIEKYTEEYCPTLLHGLSDGASEDDLNQAEIKNLGAGLLRPAGLACVYFFFVYYQLMEYH